MATTWKKYKLTEEQLVKIARLCVQEQGNLDGIRAEASLMANQLETDKARQNKYGTDGNGLYKWVRYGGWFYRSVYYMDNGSASAKQIAAVKAVLCDGDRTLPQYVDEHDCISDIRSISTGDKINRADYIKGKTIIRNVMGSVYTFWCFPAPGCDPFGYTEAAYNYVHGKSPEPVVDPTERVGVVCSVPMLSKGDSGHAVEVWQAICGAGIDGDFGSKTAKATKQLQENAGIRADGIVGADTWTKGLSSL
jgi:peptidoglycan hydrolase-like protein with peptidoglycan-binding domain